MLRAIISIGSAIVLCVSLQIANAADDPVKGDMEYGQYLSAECVTCHSATGKDKGIPPITGWDPESFVSVMEAYKNKDLDNAAMQTIAARLDDEQLASLALYFGSLPEGE